MLFARISELSTTKEILKGDPSLSFLKAFRFNYNTSFDEDIIAGWGEIVYTMLAMRNFQKTVVMSLIVALASFAGSFCMHPMAVQAAPMDMEDGASQYDSALHAEGCVSAPNDEISNAVNTCTSSCVTEVPQTINVQKISIDNAQSFIVCSTEDLYARSSESILGSVDFSGTPPPSPDILSSVFKKE